MKDDFQPCVYILASKPRGTLYVGVTSNLAARVWQHREGSLGGFTKRYGVKRLVWFEQHGTMDLAIQREKQIKDWKRLWKVQLIEERNETWDDLGVTILSFPPLASSLVIPANAGIHGRGKRSLSKAIVR